MKFHSFFSIAALCAISILSSCGNDTDAAKGAAVENDITQPAGIQPDMDPFGATASPTATPPPTAEPAQNATGVWHYTCSKGCAGGAGSAIPCPKCGTALVHNQTYHGTPNPGAAVNAPSTIDPAISIPPSGAADKKTITMPNAGKNEPPQNAAGVWHYTCLAGCAGGSGAAAPCPTCGKTLEHNKAYHQ